MFDKDPFFVAVTFPDCAEQQKQQLPEKWTKQNI